MNICLDTAKIAHKYFNSFKITITCNHPKAKAILLLLGVEKKAVLAKRRGRTYTDKDFSHTKRLTLAKHYAKYFTWIFSPIFTKSHLVGTIISSILDKLSNLNKVTLITKLLSQDLNLS